MASIVCKLSSVSPAPGNVRADIRIRLLLYGGVDDYLFASIFLSSASNFTLPVA